jgi:hypothetical protein
MPLPASRQLAFSLRCCNRELNPSVPVLSERSVEIQLESHYALGYWIC